MKRFILLAPMIFLLLSTASARNNSPVTILSASSSILYLKFSKYMMGAKIEIRDEKDNLVSQETVTQRKLIIDFYDRSPGKYVITISKNDLMERFSYTTADESGDGDSKILLPSRLQSVPSLTYMPFFLQSKSMLC
jgi:hypothetical protein